MSWCNKWFDTLKLTWLPLFPKQALQRNRTSTHLHKTIASIKAGSVVYIHAVLVVGTVLHLRVLACKKPCVQQAQGSALGRPCEARLARSGLLATTVQLVLAVAIRVEITTFTIPAQPSNSWDIPGELCGLGVSDASNWWIGNNDGDGHERGRRGATANKAIASR